MSWFAAVTTGIPDSMVREVEEMLVSFDEEKHEVIGEIPEEVRMMLVRREMLTREAGMAKLGPVEGFDPVWWMQQVEALNILMKVSLRHVGIVLPKGSPIGKGWKILKVKNPSTIIIPNEALIRQFGSPSRSDHAARAH